MSTGHQSHRQSRRRAEQFGHLGELLAALWLQARFYTVLHRRFKTPLGEIDIIARRGKTLVFAEVKTRRTKSGHTDALGAANQPRIIAAARWWLATHPEAAGLNLRFDVIVLAPYCWPVHVRGAFDATGL
ncbi:MAG: YraN family protein [Alphaproteobacteria bacterium]|nr:YraN family protein [Alphaproteobacteria bacterium]